MNAKIDISVIIPMYNSEAYIEHAIQSVLQQERHGLNLEIIVVDDGSFDSSAEVVKKIGHEKISLIRFDKNQGPPYARNAGLREARGEWVQFLDSDDRLGADLFRKFEKTIQPGMNCYLFSFMRELPEYTLRQTITSVKDKRAFGHFGGSACNKFVKREFCLEFKAFHFADDLCFCVDMMNEKELHIGLVKDAYYFYNKKREGSVTSHFNKKEFYKITAYLHEQILFSDKLTRMYILEICLAFLLDRNIPLTVSIRVAMKSSLRLFRSLPAMLFNQNRSYIENRKI